MEMEGGMRLVHQNYERLLIDPPDRHPLVVLYGAHTEYETILYIVVLHEINCNVLFFII